MIGYIESPSSSDDDDDDDDDDGLDDYDKEYLREMARYIQLPEEKQDPERLKEYAWFLQRHGLKDFALSEFGHLPIAEYLVGPSSFVIPSLSASASSSSDADKSSSGNDSAEKEGAKILFLLFAIVSLVCFPVFRGFIEKPRAPLTDNKEVAAELAPNEVAQQPKVTNEAITPSEKEVSTEGVVTRIDSDVYLEEEERLVYGTSILVRLANGAMAEVLFAVPNPTTRDAPDYATLFNRGDRVILFLRGNRSDGTVKTTKHPFLEETGEQVPGSKIHIQLDNGNEAFVFLDFDANLNPGERVRVISHEGM